MSKSHSPSAVASGAGCLTPLLIIGLVLLISWATQMTRPTQYTSMTNTEPPPGSTSVATDEWMSEFLEGYEARMGPVADAHRSMLWSNAITMCNYLSVKTKHTYRRTFRYGTDHLGMTPDKNRSHDRGSNSTARRTTSHQRVCER